MTQAIHCLLIEDEIAIRDMIRFSIDGLKLVEAADTPEAERLLADSLPDIIVLDWMLPTKSGIEFIQWLKRHAPYRDIPIIMLTAKAEEHNKIRGLEAGADDYMTKPFSPKELFTRIKTILRRGRLRSGAITVGDLVIDLDAAQVRCQSERLDLTTNEYKLLVYLAQRPGRTLSREQLIQAVWRSSADIDERTVDGQIKRLRAQLKRFQLEQYIKTVRGIGYQFVGETDE